MKIRLSEIPSHGRDFEIDLDPASLNARIAAAEQGKQKDVSPCVFFAPVKSELHIESEGSMVHVKGKAGGRYLTVCGRCAEETQQELSTRVEMVLKPKVTRGPIEAADEDIAFGFYEEKEIDCGNIIEEFLILALPYTVNCSEKCRGLCAQCGQNLNVADCACDEDRPIDPRFEALRSLKITH